MVNGLRVRQHHLVLVGVLERMENVFPFYRVTVNNTMIEINL